MPPVNTPDVDPIEATGTLLLLHTPPETLLLSAVVRPMQAGAPPVITDGNGFTVIMAVG